MRILNYEGRKFGRLTVLNKSTPRLRADKGTRGRYLCQCECGNQIIVLTDGLTSGKTKSCGCLKVDSTTQRRLQHGHTSNYTWTRTYRIWTNMKNRGTNPKNRYYQNGIRICDRWLQFENFLTDMGECPDGMSIERIDNKGNYEPENCKWATNIEQQNNTCRQEGVIWDNGKFVTIKEFAKNRNLHPTTVGRMYRKTRAQYCIDEIGGE